MIRLAYNLTPVLCNRQQGRGCSILMLSASTSRPSATRASCSAKPSTGELLSHNLHNSQLTFPIKAVKPATLHRAELWQSLTSLLLVCLRRYEALIFGTPSHVPEGALHCGLANASALAAALERRRHDRIKRMRVYVGSYDQSLGLQTDESYTLSIAAPTASLQACLHVCCDCKGHSSVYVEAGTSCLSLGCGCQTLAHSEVLRIFRATACKASPGAYERRHDVQATTVFGALRGLETFSQLVDRVTCPEVPRGSARSWPGPAAAPPAELPHSAAQAGEAAPAAEPDDGTVAGVPGVGGAGAAGRTGAVQAGGGLAGPWGLGNRGAVAARRLAGADRGPDGADGARSGSPRASSGGALAGDAHAAGQPVRVGCSAGLTCGALLTFQPSKPAAPW